jgi:hypothetical protein
MRVAWNYLVAPQTGPSHLAVKVELEFTVRSLPVAVVCVCPLTFSESTVSNCRCASIFMSFSAQSIRTSALLLVEDTTVCWQDLRSSANEAPLSSCSCVKQCLDTIGFGGCKDLPLICCSNLARCSGVNFASKSFRRVAARSWRKSCGYRIAWCSPRRRRRGVDTQVEWDA